MFRRLRLLLLLAILAFVALGTWLDRVQSTDWDGPLLVALYPVNADGSATVAAQLKSLADVSGPGNAPAFPAGSRAASPAGTLEDYFAREAREHGLRLDRPLRFTMAPALSEPPPLLPANAGIVGTMFWSLRLRWWNLGVDDPSGPTPTIRVFLLYHDPQLTSRVPHSSGLQKGLLGIAHLFAAPHMAGSNQVVIAHEVLHTLGATDKYDRTTSQPLHPDGYARPEQSPRYPQQFAELMAGRIPLSTTDARMPESLDETLIGSVTAAEIGWRTAR